VETEKMLKNILLVVALIFAVFSFTGCQTVQGVGRDITWSGKAGAEVLEKIIYPPHKNRQPEITYRNY
jgi:predicted small secreted protein